MIAGQFDKSAAHGSPIGAKDPNSPFPIVETRYEPASVLLIHKGGYNPDFK
jgi:hypothetical protein